MIVTLLNLGADVVSCTFLAFGSDGSIIIEVRGRGGIHMGVAWGGYPYTDRRVPVLYADDVCTDIF